MQLLFWGYLVLSTYNFVKNIYNSGHEWVGLKNRGIAYILDRKTNLLHNNVKIEINT